MAETSDKSWFTAKRVKLFLNIFQYFYLVCAILVLLAFITTAVAGQIQLILLPSAIVTALISFGIYNKKSWTPLVITILAAFGIVSNLLQLPGEPLASLVIIIILAFEIYFFNRRDVKEVFGVKKSAFFF